MRFFAALITCLCLATTASAQDRPNTILVLDGSGSMWGQIDGVAKITIAQEVVTDILQSFPEDQALGLTVYGHRRRGDCSDIETVVAPAIGTRDAIATAVAAIKPLGKTPMTDAIIAAAEALRYTEDSATVILVSDGVETCNPDPCAAARLLEEAGIDFTAHVIGFDVGSDPEALAQMQCLAAETGGKFLTAENADELVVALTAIVEEPAPVITTLTLEARIGDPSGALVADPVIWTIAGALDGENGNPITADIEEGSYQITGYRLIDELEVTQQVDLTAATQTAVFVFPEATPAASLVAPDSVAIGATFDITWQGPDDDRDNIQIAHIDGRYISYVYVTEGNPVQLTAPGIPGTYELRYAHRDRETIATRPIEVTPVDLGLEAPESVETGSNFQVTWTGPDSARDNIQIAEIGGSYTDYAYTAEGNPVTLTAPGTPGMYELRYSFGDRDTIFTKPIEVTESQGSLQFPASTPIGSTITVAWDGPDNPRDYIAVGKPGDHYIHYTYTESGNPLKLLMPTEAGTYEVRYHLNEGGTIITSAPIEVTDLKGRITAPDTANAGEEVTVGWDGPDYSGDYVAVGMLGEQYINYTRTSTGNPLKLLMPTEPGEYQIRYQLQQNGKIIATHGITVQDVAATLTFPAEVEAGSSVAVGWDGPNYDGDYISVGPVGERYLNYTRTSTGNPLNLLMPTEPGDYEIRYQLQQDGVVIAAMPVSVVEVGASLTAPSEVPTGSTVAVGWNGPDYSGDYISVGKAGERYINYTRTSTGNPLNLLMPTEPGDYEIRYHLQQDGVVIASVPITLTPLKVTLEAPSEADMGATIAVNWEGPDYARDYIGVGTSDGRYINYTRTSEGNPAQLLMPAEPGTYEIRYYLDQGGKIMQRIPITVNPVKAQLVAPASGVAGTVVPVGWDGPGYARDYIGIFEVGSTNNSGYTRTSTGNPVELRLPDTAGSYEIRYIMDQGSVVLASEPFEVLAE